MESPPRTPDKAWHVTQHCDTLPGARCVNSSASSAASCIRTRACCRRPGGAQARAARAHMTRNSPVSPGSKSWGWSSVECTPGAAAPRSPSACT
eukprot:364980-Chlamydomonas_euryale.AAC.5